MKVILLSFSSPLNVLNRKCNFFFVNDFVEFFVGVAKESIL